MIMSQIGKQIGNVVGDLVKDIISEDFLREKFCNNSPSIAPCCESK